MDLSPGEEDADDEAEKELLLLGEVERNWERASGWVS